MEFKKEKVSTKFSRLDPWKRHPATLSAEALPLTLQVLVREVAAQPTQEAALRYAYDALAARYRGYRILTALRLDRFLISNLEKLWQLEGFIHCNHMNYLLRTMLVASGQCATTDIEACWTQIWFFSPHQYLKVHLRDGSIREVDLWGKAYGIPFGEHAHGLKSGTVFAKIKTW